MAKSSSKRKALRVRRASDTGGLLTKVMTEAERLLETGRVDEARRLLESHLGRLANHAPLRAALATVYGQLGRVHDAAVQARIALDLSPRQPDYHLLAALSYFAAGYYTFAHRARAQWLELQPEGPLVDEMLRLEAEYRTIQEVMCAQYGGRDLKSAEEAGYRLDEGTWSLAQSRWGEALHHFQEASKLLPGWEPPRNNASTALFFLGRYAEAIAEAETVLRAAPENTHALSNLVRYYLTVGDTDAARAAGDRLVALPASAQAREPMELRKRIEALALLDRDADVDRTTRQLKRIVGELSGHDHLYWGIAAANLGRRKDALAYLQRAEELGISGPLVAEALDALRRNQPGPGIAERYTYTHFSEWAGREVLEALHKLVTHDEQNGRRDQQAWDDLLRRHPQLPLVFRKMLYETADDRAIDTALEVLGQLRTPPAIATIREFALGQLGSDDQRIGALRILQEIGALSADTTIDMWIRGERQTIRPLLQEITTEHRSDYAEAAWAAYKEAVIAQHDGRAADAERAYQRMLQIEPNAKEAYYNLAVLYGQRGDPDTANAYLDKALAIDPLYVYPRTSRALQALAQEDIAGAKAWLEPLHGVTRWHPAAMVHFQKAWARVAIAEKQYDVARSSLTLAQQLAEEDQEVAELLRYLELLENVSRADAWFRKGEERYRRRRESKPLPADPALGDCLGLLTKGDMVGISHVLNLGSVSALRKAALQEHLLALFSDPGFLARIVADLTPEERRALQAILDRNGMMARDEFVATFGEEDERPYLEYHATSMTSVLGRLRAHGLAHIGTAQGRVVVVIPRELRPGLAELLATDGA